MLILSTVRQCLFVGQIERLSNKGYNFPRDKGPGNLADRGETREQTATGTGNPI